MAAPGTAFTLSDVTDPDAPRAVLRLDAEPGDLFDGLRGRLRAILGPDFIENALAVDFERDGIHLGGYAALPTYSRGAAVAQHLFVNGRPVRDRLLIGALRAAYSDVLARDRHPVAALFITCAPDLVDVNVHPAKAEVRFREPGTVRGLVVSALKRTLADAGHRGSTTTGVGMLGAFRPDRGASAADRAGWFARLCGSHREHVRRRRMVGPGRAARQPRGGRIRARRGAPLRRPAAGRGAGAGA